MTDIDQNARLDAWAARVTEGFTWTDENRADVLRVWGPVARRVHDQIEVARATFAVPARVSPVEDAA
ncbi:hypothetical protein [Promicromonospora iranensis]|uniref:Uncharacterized protein n=1 Tax=Promicromonospora iranensis TaxID=1105144 RepID=A0ABU2CWE5_9MICO|nr:hypothetical protein [Promicromonospora iranensis]MDR7385677.1 hypothetical protein [Promicromonospora iranensis]